MSVKIKQSSSRPSGFQASIASGRFGFLGAPQSSRHAEKMVAEVVLPAGDCHRVCGYYGWLNGMSGMTRSEHDQDTTRDQSDRHGPIDTPCRAGPQAIPMAQEQPNKTWAVPCRAMPVQWHNRSTGLIVRINLFCIPHLFRPHVV